MAVVSDQESDSPGNASQKSKVAMTIDKQRPGIWVGQLTHFSCAMILVTLVWVAWKIQGQPFPVAFWIAIAFPIVHQVFVWLAWRFEIRSEGTSKAIGNTVASWVSWVMGAASSAATHSSPRSTRLVSRPRPSPTPRSVSRWRPAGHPSRPPPRRRPRPAPRSW